MLLVTTALSGLLAGVIQTPPPQTPPPATVQQPQTPPAADEEPDDSTASAETGPAYSNATELGALTVTGQRPRGAVDTDIAPIQSLSAEEIQAYGASTIEELLTYLEPVTRSTRGRGDNQPVTLINGRRTTGFREIAGIPTEAIERMDILPEEVALQFGYRADQRVVNIVLKANFRSYTGEVRGGAPTEGGRTTSALLGGVLHIAGASRYSLDVNHNRSTALFETERDIVRDPTANPFDLIGNVAGAPLGSEIDPALSALVGETALIAPVPQGVANPGLAAFAGAWGDPRSGDLSAYRTLLSASEQSQVRGTIKRDLNSTTQATFSGNLQRNETEGSNGLPGVILSLPAANAFSPFSDDTLVYRYLDVPTALSRQTDTLTANAGVLFDGFLGDNWRWTLNGSYDRVETDTLTGRGFSAAPFQTRLNANDPTANPFAALSPADFTALPFDTAESVSEVLSAELNLNGGLFFMPAGEVRSTFTFGADTRSLDSVSVRSGVTTERSQSRDRLNGQASFDIPLTTKDDVLPQFGELSMNLNLGYEELSDFGGLRTLGVGFNWQPIEKLSFSANYTNEEGAPSISQLNDPVISTPAVPVFDFQTGETVLVNRIDGGNPNLVADNRQVQRLGVNFQPFTERNFSLSSTWTRSVTDDPINAFPAITPDLEAALPERFTRNASGDLVEFDARPINFDRAERQDLRTGLTFSMPFGTPRAMPQRPEATPSGPSTAGDARAAGVAAGTAAAASGQSRATGRAGGTHVMAGPMIIMSPGPAGGDASSGGGMRTTFGPGSGGGMMRMRGRGPQPGQGMFNFSMFHTYRIQDEIVIRDGLPVLDLLDGAATSSRGGSPRHELQLQAGMFRNGFGTFLNANWRGSTRVDGGAGPDLFFEDQTTVNLNMFMDLNQRTSWVERYPWLKGTRVTLGVQNVFDSEPTVRSANGDTPLNYQPDFLDPQGRSFNISLRKILF